MLDYDWPGPFKPFAHQVATAEFIVRNSRCFVFNDMGTGKTASALWAVDYLMKTKQVSKVLIVAPLSTLQSVWLEEAFALMPTTPAYVLHGTAERRKQLYQSMDSGIGIINFDGVYSILNLLQEDAKSGTLSMVIIDEASAYKHINTKRFKIMHNLLKQVSRVVAMTGTPCPSAPTDAYGLAKLLSIPLPKEYSTLYGWRYMTMYQRTQFQWLPRHNAMDKVYKVLQPAIRFDKADCIDLPPVVTEELEVELTREQQAAYKMMLNDMKIEFEGNGGELNAINAADKINKLRQIACGVVHDPETCEYLYLPNGPRVEAVIDVIESAPRKVIVVVPFKGILRNVYDRINQHYSVEVINGDTPQKERAEIVARFQNEEDPKVLLVHPKVMSHGITLTAANVLVFFAPIFSAEESKQITERINRPGQTHSMTVVHIYATPLERDIYKKIQESRITEQSLLDLYKFAISET